MHIFVFAITKRVAFVWSGFVGSSNFGETPILHFYWDQNYVEVNWKVMSNGFCMNPDGKNILSSLVVFKAIILAKRFCKGKGW